MATAIDISVLKSFSGVFPFLLVLVLVYAILIKTDFFSDKKGMAGIIAFLAAMMTLFSNVAIKTINLMTPWFVLFLIFGTLLILAYMSFGVKSDTIVGVLTGESYSGTFANFVLAIVLIITLGSFFAVLSEESKIEKFSTGANVTIESGAGQEGFWQALFNPKVLGMVLVLLVGFFTIQHMTSPK